MGSVSVSGQEWVASTGTYDLILDFTWSPSEGDYSVPYYIYYYHGKYLIKSTYTAGYIYDGMYYCTVIMSGFLPYIKHTISFLGNEIYITIKPHPDHFSDNYYPSYYPTMQRQWFEYNLQNTWRGETWCCVANTLASCREKIEHDIRPSSQTKYSVSWIYGGVNQSYDEYGGLLYVDSLEFMKNIGTPNARKIKALGGVKGYPDIYKKQTSTESYDGASDKLLGAVERYNTIYPSKYSSYGKISNYAHYQWYDIYEVMKYVDDSKNGNGNAVFITIEITKEFDDANDNKNVVSKGVCPRLTQTSSNRGGHSMIILGWKKINDEYYWICQNSWDYKHPPTDGSGSMGNKGTWIETGDNGLIYIPVSWCPRQSGSTWNGGIYGYYVVFGGDYGTDAFQWDTPKVKGKPFNVTASEWTRLQNYINECLGYASKSLYSFKAVKPNDTFTWGHYNDVRISITNLGSAISIPFVLSGYPIKADENINKIVESLNSVT